MSRPHPRPAVAHRLTAVLGVALVLALNLLAVCPEAHAWLHGGQAGALDGEGGPTIRAASAPPERAADDDCVVVKFSHGHGGFALTPVRPDLLSRLVVAVPAGGRALRAGPPAHLLPPGRGPPAA